MTVYKDWLSRFMGIYRYTYGGKDIENPMLALGWLEETKPSEQELEKIWAAQVAHNIERDKAKRGNPRATVKRDTPNIYLFLSKRKWDRTVESSMEIPEVIEDHCYCGKKAFAKTIDGPICCWHYSEKYCNDGPTGLNILRSAYKNRIPRNPGETGHQYLARVYGSGKKKRLDGDTSEVPRPDDVPEYGPEDVWQAG